MLMHVDLADQSFATLHDCNIVMRLQKGVKGNWIIEFPTTFQTHVCLTVKYCKYMFIGFPHHNFKSSVFLFESYKII